MPGSIFPAEKYYPVAEAATLTAHILPVPMATPKTEAASGTHQPPFRLASIRGEPPLLHGGQPLGLCRVFPLHPRLIQKLVAAPPGQCTHCEDEICMYKICKND